jgi:4-hydroxyphenylpyruvate dioxygenase
VRAVGITVDDASEAYNVAVANGAHGVLAPTTLHDEKSKTSATISEIKMFGDSVIRWISGDYKGAFLPNYEASNTPDINYGILRLDHAVSNVPKLFPAIDYLTKSTGFHEFSEFTAEDVGTVDSGLNSMVLASNSEFILLPVNEPTFGTKRKSQIQNYLEHNNGAGVQHLALMTRDIFHTMRELRKRSYIGGFEFMPAPPRTYYENLPARIGADTLTAEEFAELEVLGLLADKDDQGVLLQVFTKPLGDRPTIFIEIIQRIGCDRTISGEFKEQSAGCGGFGKGNFSELFKSIEEFEKQQEAAATGTSS